MQKPPEESGSGDRISAGLLWALLGAEGRRRVAGSLSVDDLTDLNRAAGEFRQAPVEARRRAIVNAREILRPEQGRLPVLFSGILLVLTALVFVYYRWIHPERSWYSLLPLFGPVVVSVFSPVSLMLLPSVKRTRLFRPTLGHSRLLYAVPAYVALLWLLYWINGDTASYGLPLFDLCLLGSAALLAPLFEEVVFREVIPAAAGRSPHAAGHLISILIFAILHLPPDGEVFLYYVLAASVLSLLRILTDGLFWPVIVHSLGNLTSLLLISG